jgi:hypothetical protein
VDEQHVREPARASIRSPTRRPTRSTPTRRGGRTR